MTGLRKLLVGLVVAASLLAAAGPAFAYDGRDDRGGSGYNDGGYNDGGDCDWRGDCGGQSYDGQWSNEDHNRNRNRNRGAFSPGPFDRSPVDFSNSCISLDCSGRDKGEKKNPPPKASQHDRPSEMITNPAKLIQFPITIVEMSFDFAQRIMKLVV